MYVVELPVGPGGAFDPSGRYLTLLRRSQVVELWRTDPLRKELGPLPAFGIPAVMSYVEGTGRLATNNRIRIYRVGERDYEVSLDLGAYSESSHDPPAYKFTHASRDGQTLLFYQAGSSQIIRPLSLRPDSWAEALCRVLGDSDLTPEEREGQPVPVPFEPVCP
ncbi:hypothetical protein ACFZAE_01570 [Streptomyces scabiei]|uniref:hypothetical protein n=1 Tax=Streptomyces scabiei TaxID=1930 RepID=UPI0036EBC57C